MAVIENFQGGNLGLQLADTATPTPSTTTITGDIAPDDIDPNTAGIQAASDANGNPLGTAQAYEDILRGTAADDHILNGGIGTDNTISLGGGICYGDIALSKSDNDLILEVGENDQITLKDWYKTDTNYKSVLNFQIVAEAMASFDCASNDPLLNKSIQNFDFTAIVGAYDQARGSSCLEHWNVANSLLAVHLSGSDTEALGGDLAHQYGMNGSFTGVNLGAARMCLTPRNSAARRRLWLHYRGCRESG